MRVLGIPRQSLDWLVSNQLYIDALAADLSRNAESSAPYLAIGSLRVRSDSNVVVLWHRDYAATAVESEWSIIRIDGPMGLLHDPEISQTCLARMLRVAHLRFRNLNLPGSYIVRSFEGNRFACLAGRGGGAWQSSIGWIDERVQQESQSTRLIGFVGPWHDPGDNAGNQAVALLQRLERDREAFRRAVFRCRQLREIPSGSSAEPREWPELLGLEQLDSVALDEGEEVAALDARLEANHVPKSDLTYRECMGDASPLTSAQRRVMSLDRIGKAPVRIHGPAGSGKSLVMQLLAVRVAARASKGSATPLSVLYLAHNTSAKDQVTTRLEQLTGEDLELADAVRSIVKVTTINDLAQDFFDRSEIDDLLDRDNSASKAFQIDLVRDALHQELTHLASRIKDEVDRFPTLRAALTNDAVLEQLARSVVGDIGYVIKAQLRDQTRESYVLAEQPYSRLHGALTEAERDVVWNVYKAYDRQIAQEEGLLDNDDVALSLLQNLATPLWRQARKRRGCDLLFVDEAQLYSPTEKLLFQYLCRNASPPHPIVLALDRAQDLEGFNERGLGLLGVGPVNNVEVYEMQRCSPAITQIALDIIFQTTDVFDEDFRPFPRDLPFGTSKGGKAMDPVIRRSRSERLGKGALRAARDLRRMNYRSVGVISLTPGVAKDVAAAAAGGDVMIIEDRAAVLPSRPHVALATPATVGGLEFDAVVIVGCEQGLVPPTVASSEGFQIVLDQQFLRELYLSVTRAKEAVIFLISAGSEPSRFLQSAIRERHIREE